MDSETSQTIGKPAKKPDSPRARRLKILAAVVVLAGIVYGAWWYFYASNFVSTDNAYTATEVAQVTSAVSGIIREVNVVDTQSVKKGDILVVIDDTDAKLALNQAEADCAKARAELASAESDYKRAAVDLKRRNALIAIGAVSGDELTKTENAHTSSAAAIESAKAAIAQATARIDQAKVDLSRTIIRAPVDGTVAKRTVQVGQKIPADAQLLVVVPVQDMHVDANFKEGQLEKVRTGQKAELYSDLYGKSVIYHGTVEGFSGGTGSAFALIPAQNATGNWIKVVQRLPTRIRLDPEELKANPLQVGLSMTVTIDTREKASDK